MFLTEIEQLNTMLQKKRAKSTTKSSFSTECLENIRLKTSASKKIYSFRW